MLGKSRFTVVSMENNTIINNNTRIHFCLLATVNLFLSLWVHTHYRFTNIFSHSVSCLLGLLMVSFDAQNFNFDEVQSFSHSLSFLVAFILGLCLSNLCLMQAHENLPLCFFKTFIGLVCIFKFC